MDRNNGISGAAIEAFAHCSDPRITQRFRGTPTPHDMFVACSRVTPSCSYSAAHGGAPELSRSAACGNASTDQKLQLSRRVNIWRLQ